MDNRPIGIFDSGVGGLSVLSEIKKRLPHENLIYVGDTKRFPFGNKSKETIVEISKEISNYLLEQDVKLIIVACGTATSQALEELQEHFSIPIIGIIKPTITYNIDKNISNIGVIATKGTIRSKAWEKSILDKNNDINVTSVEAPLLAPLAEEGWVINEIAKLSLIEYLKPFINSNIQSLILGCTHYPLFKPLIEEILPNIKLIDTGVETSKYLITFLSDLNLDTNSFDEGTVSIRLTDKEDSFLSFANNLLNISNIKSEIIYL